MITTRYADLCKGGDHRRVSEGNPYGLFTVNFKGNPVMNGQVIPFTLMKGFMKTEMDPAAARSS